MPTKHSVKEYVPDGYYHVYNRGVERRDIFLDNRDYKTFLHFLKLYLSDPEILKGLNPLEGSTLRRKNFYQEIDLLAYCLMPNHFHLLVKQRDEDSLSRFMKCLSTNYSMYFNKRYERVGSLFQGIFKAVLVENDDYLLHLSRYIHLNPHCKGQALAEYDWSSYQEYLELRGTKWVEPEFILGIFNENVGNEMIGKSAYKNFVEDYAYDSAKIVGNLALE